MYQLSRQNVGCNLYVGKYGIFMNSNIVISIQDRAVKKHYLGATMHAPVPPTGGSASTGSTSMVGGGTLGYPPPKKIF